MTLFSYLLTILGIFYWIFRAIITAMYTSGVNFVVQPLNVGFEIALVFATIPCMIFVLKRNVIGAACYMAIYVSYFGTAIYNSMNSIADSNGLTVADSAELMLAIVGVVIPMLTFVDIWLNKHRKSVFAGKKSTDWYYNTDKYDRQYDERADRNQYKR